MRHHKFMLQRIIAGVMAVALVTTSGLPTEDVSAAKKSIKTLNISKPIVSTLALKQGESFSLKVKVSPKALAKKLKYSSNKKKVASVSSKGKIKAKKTGKATITVSSKTKPKKSVKVKVTVYKKFLKAKKVTINAQNTTLNIGETMALTANVTPKKATIKNVTYVSEDKSVATVNSKGVVIAKKEGTSKITAYASDGRGAKATCTITVKKSEANVPEETATVAQTVTPSTTAPVKTAEPIQFPPNADHFTLATGDKAASVYVDEKAADYDGLSLVADSFAEDISLVTTESVKPEVVTKASELKGSAIIVGSIGNNDVIDSLIAEGRLDVSEIKGKWETYKIQIMDNPVEGVENSVVVVGSDKRGAIYGLYHISELMGVSPWVYWADTVPEKKDTIDLKENELNTTSKEPSVKYRGIFLNDEAPSLTGWVKEKFDNYNELFYEHVYELILRCKGNYLWPAMWSNTFSEDGEESNIANAELADKYGIVMGTSHHEPMCRAGVEWGRLYENYTDDKLWDFNENGEAITKFWEDGIKRNMPYENVYTLGMRGESDSALEGGVKEIIELLKNVITTQKKILSDHKLSDAPQVLTVYKEVEQYWHGTDQVEGLKKWNVLDDVTIMLCDDNFGNMRTLPDEELRDRKGGWGMYYHFDYHGGPTSYEWVNTVELNKVWEQMTMAYEHGIDDIWIVNVGDLKPMEMNISYFLDMAYDYETWGENGRNKTEDYMKQWVSEQFGTALDEEQVEDVTSLFQEYTWLNTSCKPESLNSATYSATNYNEAQEILNRAENMIAKADEYKAIVPEELQATYYQLVYYPVVASANVAKMQLYSGLNKHYYELGSVNANLYATLIEECIQLDKDLQDTYNNDMPGVGDKWKKMMSSPHVGFITWNSDGWAYPEAKWVSAENESTLSLTLENQSAAVTEGNCSFDTFTNIGKEMYTVTLANMGGEALEYSLTPSADWIQVSKNKGTIKAQDTFDVSVDWSKNPTEDGNIVVMSGGQSITIQVPVKTYDTSALANNTYVYANGYASMMPGQYVATGAGTNGTEIQVIDNYGKTGQSLKSFPSNHARLDKPEDGAYVEYEVSVEKAGTYKLTTFTAPSNNLDRDNVGIYYGVSVNGGTAEKINTVDPSTFLAGEYSGSWCNDVKASGRKTESEIELKAGVNTLRIYAMDPAFVLQKLVVSEKSMAYSHIGPAESYYVGKEETTSVKDATIVDCYNLPGKLVEEMEAKEGEEYTYDAIVTKEEKYSFVVTGTSANGATAKLYWKDTEIGSVEFGEEVREYAVKGTVSLEPGMGKLRLVMESGEATIQSVQAILPTYLYAPGSIQATQYTDSKEDGDTVTIQEGTSYAYGVRVPEANKFEISLRGTAATGATVKVYWNEEEMGTVEFSEANKKYTLAEPVEMEAGDGVLRVEGITGEGLLQNIVLTTVELGEKQEIDVMASSSADGYVANQAYDRDDSTSWKPDATDGEKTLTFDFGANYQFDRYAITEKGDVSSYKVEIYDGSQWKEIHQADSIDNGAFVFVQGKEVVEGSQVRFTFVGENVDIAEIKLTPYVNWAWKDQGVSFEAKSKEGKAINVPEGVITDGDRITVGMQEGVGTSNDSSRHSVTMNFSEAHTIDTVRLFTLQEGNGVVPNLDMTSEKAQYSYKFSYLDGTEWKEIGATVRPDQGTNPKVMSEFALKEQVETTAIKVEIYTSHWIRINEWEAVESQCFVPIES